MSVEVITFGCRLNAHESALIRQHAESANFDDTIVFNTCAVTNEAVAQARQAIRRARRKNPEARIVVTGCAAQTETSMFAAMPEVDRIVGNDDKMHGEVWHADTRIAVSDIMMARAIPAQPIVRAQSGLPRAYLQIQNGCDHRCTFCVIPFGRGNSRSLAAVDVVAQARTLTEAGHAEIVLTGVDITSYGSDLPAPHKLGTLVKRVLREVPELKRLRISSIDSVEADRDLLDLVGNEPRLMPHLHLSLQSGDDLILKRMKRRHSRNDAIAFCDQVRRLRPDIVLGADIIAGFPTETETMFARSQDLVADCDLSLLHVFPYSPRPNTPAARMPQVNGASIRDRAQRLRVTGELALQKRLTSEVGRTRSVLIESARQGRTEHFLPVAIAGQRTGAVFDLTISGHDGTRLVA